MRIFVVAVTVVAFAICVAPASSGALSLSESVSDDWTKVMSSGPTDPQSWVLYERIEDDEFCQAFASPGIDPSDSDGGWCSPVPSARPRGEPIVGGDAYVDGVYEGERYLIGKLASPLDRVTVIDKAGRRYKVRMSGRSFVATIGRRHPQRVRARSSTKKRSADCPIVWSRAVDDAFIMCPPNA